MLTSTAGIGSHNRLSVPTMSLKFCIHCSDGVGTVSGKAVYVSMVFCLGMAITFHGSRSNKSFACSFAWCQTLAHFVFLAFVCIILLFWENNSKKVQMCK